MRALLFLQLLKKFKSKMWSQTKANVYYPVTFQCFLPFQFHISSIPLLVSISIVSLIHRMEFQPSAPLLYRKTTTTKPFNFLYNCCKIKFTRIASLIHRMESQPSAPPLLKKNKQKNKNQVTIHISSILLPATLYSKLASICLPTQKSYLQI